MTMNKLKESQMKSLEAGARNNFRAYCCLTQKNYEFNWHHRIIANKLEAVERGEIKRLMVFMPPRHGKSELTTIKFPTWYLGKNPTHPIITVSYSGDLAGTFGGKARDVVDSEVYKRIFNVGLKADSKSRVFWEIDKIEEGVEGGSYTSAGLGGAITGKGAKLLIIDDPIKNKEEADSVTYREKTWDYYTSTLYTRLEKDAAIILILTRWNYDDLAGRLLEAEKQGGEFAENWDIIEFPAIALKDEEHRKQGEPLWEKKYDIDSLNKTKQTVGLMVWSSLYQQQPLISELQEFKVEYFRYFEEEEIEDKRMTINILIDPATGKKAKKENCEVGIIAVAKLDDKPYWYILEDNSGMIDPSKNIDIVFEMYQRLRETYSMANIKVWVESNAYQSTLSHFMRKEMQRIGVYFNVEEIITKSDKEVRIRGLQPMYKNGIIKHRPSMKNGELENQLIQFPVGKLKDRPDTLSFNQEAMLPTDRKKQKQRPKNTRLTGF